MSLQGIAALALVIAALGYLLWRARRRRVQRPKGAPDVGVERLRRGRDETRKS